MIFIAHRGFRVGVAENTFNAFDKACQMDMDFIELDVHLSKDEELFVIHDDILDRTMNAKGKISSKSKNELKDIKSKEYCSFLPTLNNVINEYLLSNRYSINLMIELKSKNSGIATANLIQKYHLENRVVFSGHSIIELRSAHNLIPSIPICLNITHCPDYPLRKFLKCTTIRELPLPFDMISLRSSEITKEFINKCHNLKIQALAWDFLKYSQPIEQMQLLIQKGIDGFLFDDPATVKPIREVCKEVC